LAQLPDDPQLWDKIMSDFEVDMYCAIDVRVPNSGTELSASEIQALAKRRLVLQLDFYAFGEDESE